MSYGMAVALQSAVFAALTANQQVMTLSGGAIHDALPSGPVAPLLVVIGPEQVRDASDKTGAGAVHDFSVTVVSAAAGFSGAKALAAAISDALSGADLVLSRGRLVALAFVRARARRVDGAREIELWFRARLDEAA
ncbi:DUF3168 domain-containing protein [uncultured Roseicyclus sp.]|jgi:hypothetical protein|uniref:DUF3168 domain-containing protein n=1 Tax=uncultured Roseicyclus sp. TaxID=543072 RepID=UPI002601A544|nr:DUF3168 domain-containing protein [uncultured Roseicyclus sp.]